MTSDNVTRWLCSATASLWCSSEALADCLCGAVVSHCRYESEIRFCDTPQKSTRWLLSVVFLVVLPSILPAQHPYSTLLWTRVKTFALSFSGLDTLFSRGDRRQRQTFDPRSFAHKCSTLRKTRINPLSTRRRQRAGS